MRELSSILTVFALSCAFGCASDTASMERKSGADGPAVHPAPAAADVRPRESPAPASPQPANPAATAEPDPPRDTQAVLLLAGGRGSCGDKRAGEGFATEGNYMRADMGLFLKALRARWKTVRYFLSCYEQTGERTALATEASPEVARRMPLDELVKHVLDEVGRLDNAVVYIVGHSYGGWLAMHYAAKMPQKFKIRVLATIDPISRVTCVPSNFVRWGVQGVLGGLSFAEEVPGCDTFPKDFDGATRAAIAARSNTWVNYFQRSYRIIHAAAIPEAHENIERPFVAGSNNEHNEIGLDGEKLVRFFEADVARP